MNDLRAGESQEFGWRDGWMDDTDELGLAWERKKVKAMIKETGKEGSDGDEWEG